MRRRVLIIGLDGAPASGLFARMDSEFPNLARLARRGTFGLLRSSDPPITVPAWACMFSGKDPGELGLYGFRHRYGPGYAQQQIVHSGLLPRGMLWDWVARRGQRTVLLGVPPTFPPPAIEGLVVSCLLTPKGASTFTHPRGLQARVADIAPDYQFDIANFRELEDEALLEQALSGLRARFRLARELCRREPWDLFVMTDIGSDRVQHGLWGLSEGSGWGQAVRSYYQEVDREIGEWLFELADDVCVWIVSDHGAQASRGGFYLNEWLRRYGWLRLRDDSVCAPVLPLAQVDWKRTVAWAEGGYVGRIYLNVRGRQPEGVVSQGDIERVREELREALRSSADGGASGRIPMEVYAPEELYREWRGYPPDLFVYADGLRLRVFGGVGAQSLLSDKNDTGRDRANHHPDGLYICYDPGAVAHGPGRVMPITEIRSYWEAQLAGQLPNLGA